VKEVLKQITPLRFLAGTVFAYASVASRAKMDFGVFLSCMVYIVIFIVCDFLLYYVSNKWLYWILQLVLSAGICWWFIATR
jgi:hypothetical protein